MVGANQSVPTLSGGVTIELALSILGVGVFQLQRIGIGF